MKLKVKASDLELEMEFDLPRHPTALPAALIEPFGIVQADDAPHAPQRSHPAAATLPKPQQHAIQPRLSNGAPSHRKGPTWSLYPIRCATKDLTECCLCGKKIVRDDSYKDGGQPTMRAHLRCVDQVLQRTSTPG